MRYVACICVHDSVVTLRAYVYEAHKERVGSLIVGRHSLHWF